MITLTKSAAQHINKMLNELPNAQGMRVTLKQAGCTGFKYIVEATDTINETDHIFESEGIRIIIDKKNIVFIDDTEIDYIQQGLNAKLVFNNPHVDEACGCGESFTFKNEEEAG
jgi:iron-sulfur cluster assembly protein